MTFGILNDLFRGICVGVAASITVGPVAVLCIQRTLSKSRRSGIVSGIGVACADTFMAMAALFFYSMLQTQIEQYNTLRASSRGVRFLKKCPAQSGRAFPCVSLCQEANSFDPSNGTW